jgi:serine/threonine protein kinase, bacterial
MDSRESTPFVNRGVPRGTRLNGIYEIDEMIGSGGMGEIYKGHELQTGAAVAIKMLLPDMAENEAALGLFRREAAALHNLPHDAIVRYFLFTVEPTLQRPYLAMEFVDGRSLSEMLQAGPLHFDKLAKLTRRIASGLEAAHERGIVHRDVSPDNIVVPRNDVTRAKIIDFGIARLVQAGDPTIIGSGFAGKENYVSPEQVGLFGGEVTPKSDIYSLGLVIFYAITGQKLDMAGTQFQLVEKRRHLPDLGAVDGRFLPLLERMLQPDPANRPTMADVANWSFPTKGQVGRTDLGGPGTFVSAEAGSSNRRSRVRTALAMLAILVVVLGAGFGVYRFFWSTGDSWKRALSSVSKLVSPELKPGDQPKIAASPIPSGATSRIVQVRSFVERYDGGDCFFVVPIAISQSAAVIEGYGASTGRFQAFVDGFKREQGFEPSVGIRQVTQDQCPALRFLSQLHGDQSRAPRVILAATDVKNGETLSGTIENVENGDLVLLLVTDSGQVRNLSGLLKPGLDSMSFSIGLKSGDNSVRPQLLLALTVSQSLGLLKQPQLGTAGEFFSKLLSEARRNNVTLASAVRYFKLGG